MPPKKTTKKAASPKKPSKTTAKKVAAVKKPLPKVKLLLGPLPKPHTEDQEKFWSVLCVQDFLKTTVEKHYPKERAPKWVKYDDFVKDMAKRVFLELVRHMSNFKNFDDEEAKMFTPKTIAFAWESILIETGSSGIRNDVDRQIGVISIPDEVIEVYPKIPKPKKVAAKKAKTVPAKKVVAKKTTKKASPKKKKIVDFAKISNKDLYAICDDPEMKKLCMEIPRCAEKLFQLDIYYAANEFVEAYNKKHPKNEEVYIEFVDYNDDSDLEEKEDENNYDIYIDEKTKTIAPRPIDYDEVKGIPSFVIRFNYSEDDQKEVYSKLIKKVMQQLKFENIHTDDYDSDPARGEWEFIFGKTKEDVDKIVAQMY